jgi:hypothetical protein
VSIPVPAANSSIRSHHRSVQFGSTTAVEYKSDDPVAQSLTPMPNDQAAALYPIDGPRTTAAEETLIQETKVNAALLAAWDVDDSDDDENDNNIRQTASMMFAVGNSNDDDTDRPYFVATRPLHHRPRRSSAFFSPAEGSRNLLGEETNTNRNKDNNKEEHLVTGNHNLTSLSSLSVHSPPLLVDENGQSCAANAMLLQYSPLIDNYVSRTGDDNSTVSVSSSSVQLADDHDDENIAMVAASNQHDAASVDSNDYNCNNGDDSNDDSLPNLVQDAMQHVDPSTFEVRRIVNRVLAPTPNAE